jgi:DNA-binding IclR family transcriptional regulator
MNKYLIPNLVKACGLLSILTEHPDGVSSAEIEKLVKIPRTSAFRILKTLCSEELVEKRGMNFYPGPALMKIGLKSLQSSHVRSLSISFLSNLAVKTNCTAHLAVPAGHQSLILEVHDSPNPVRVASRPGTIVPLYCSSTGKVFLAFRYEDGIEDYFSSHSCEPVTPHTIVTLDQMKQEIARIKKDGYALDNQEYHEDVRCLAAPVYDSQGYVVAAIGITGPAMQFTEDKAGPFGLVVKCAANELSAELGYHP